MEQTTQEQKTSTDEEIASPRTSRAGGLRNAVRWIPIGLFGFVALFSAIDVISDAVRGASAPHLGVEMIEVVVSLAGLVFMWRQLRNAEARARDLERDLDGTRADLARWRAEAQDHLLGLGAAIDRQFERWGLTPAERDVALLLLKGLSLKEIAELRTTSERTVRQQSLGVYRKAGLAGRAELAAFFLEDLLLPSDATEEKVREAR